MFLRWYYKLSSQTKTRYSLFPKDTMPIAYLVWGKRKIFAEINKREGIGKQM